MPFWFTIEEGDEDGRLHIHGEISFGDIHCAGKTMRALRRILAPIREALKAASGEWDSDRDVGDRQLRFAKGTPDARWAGYCSSLATRRGLHGGVSCADTDHPGAGSRALGARA